MPMPYLADSASILGRSDEADELRIFAQSVKKL